jgi:hypothetical protein
MSHEDQGSGYDPGAAGHELQGRATGNTDHAALLEKIKAADKDGLDDETLGRVICAARGWRFHSKSQAPGDDGTPDFVVWAHGFPNSVYSSPRRACPDDSTDAALELVNDALGDVWYILGKGRTRADEPLYGAAFYFGEEKLGEGEYEHSQALAILAALLAVKAT